MQSEALLGAPTVEDHASQNLMCLGITSASYISDSDSADLCLGPRPCISKNLSRNVNVAGLPIE